MGRLPAVMANREASIPSDWEPGVVKQGRCRAVLVRSQSLSSSWDRMGRLKRLVVRGEDLRRQQSRGGGSVSGVLTR